MTTADVTATFKYYAFISYSHADRKWAAWLHRAIETYRVPARLVADGAPARLSPLFRDREELASSHDLGQRIEQALADSGAFILICSPRAAASPWVNEEVRQFGALGRAHRIFCLIVDGEPHAQHRGYDPSLECFPPALLELAAEPIAADVRAGGDSRAHAKLKVIAGLLDVGLDDLRQRDLQRRNRRLVLLSAASAAGIVITSVLAGYAWLARNEAEASRVRAEREAETARQTTRFMVGLFNVVDPGEARGRNVTAYEILERGVDHVRTDLDAQPEVRATLLETMGKVFTGLGLYRRSVELLQASLDAQPRTPSALVAMGDALYLEGDYEAAEQRYKSAIEELGESPWNAEWSGAVNGSADVLNRKEDYTQAIELYRRAISNDVATWGAQDERTAHSYNGLAMAQLYSGDFENARQNYLFALDAYRAALGADHPKVAATINDLGAVSYFSGDNERAAAYYREALPVYRKLYGDVHPEIAAILNNIGRIELERNAIDAAQTLLEESVAIDRKLGRSEHEDFLFGLSSLALVYRARDDLARSRALFDEAEALARHHSHRLWGPIQVSRAELECISGDTDSAAPLLEQADARLREDYPDDAWRIAILQSVRGECLSVAGERSEGERLLLESLPAIESHWGKGALFTADARQRLAQHYERVGDLVAARRYRAG